MPVTDPLWAPVADDVADFITSRTFSVKVPGADTPTGAFSADTYPTDQQVDRLIEGACAWVTVVTGPIDSTLEKAARSVATMRAAGMVELSFPERDADIDVATSMLQQAFLARQELITANQNAGVEPVAMGAHSPVYNFPPAESWDGNTPTRSSST